MWIIAQIFAASLGAGILGAIMGIGGGIFLVPLLHLFFHLPMRIAVGTSLMAVIATSAGVSAFAPRGRGADIGLALKLEMFTAAGAILGGWSAGFFSGNTLSILFSVIVFFTAGYMLFKAFGASGKSAGQSLFLPDYTPRHWKSGIAGSAFAGMVSGLLGVGGGFIKVPIMYAVMDVPLGVATATSNFMVGITAAASVFVYFGRGDIYPVLVIPTALGVFIGAMFGAFVLSRLRISWLRNALIILLVVIGIQMLIKGIG